MDRGDGLSTRADALMDGLVADLERPTATPSIPSIAFPGFPPEPVRQARAKLNPKAVPHAPNERVHFTEPRSAVIAEAAFPREYAKTYGDTAKRAAAAGGGA
ncbi:hypothetical protein ACIQPT_18640 [Streptomyces sp. NPDC091289]|uniref:hypothetical protein n=1 Tax=Streptomyces sp. NPDC091289 TaxID=3365989 RepID=UPI00381A2736